ncbi:MAG: hypothetical protein E7300_02720 [Lachnospiraceae bacterium]|nr:hypothetical protein [Lachnospiraceae bacterium]
MDRVFLEVLVARKRSALMMFLKIWGMILTVAGFLGTSMNLLFLIPLLGGVILAGFAWMHEKTEFEYSYFERELSVDRILAQSSRKRMAVYNLDELEAAAPAGSYHLDGYKNRKYDVKDYGSHSGAKTFEMYFGGRTRVILDWDDELMQAMRSASPSKIYLQ